MAECLQLWGGGQGHVNIEWGVRQGGGRVGGWGGRVYLLASTIGERLEAKSDFPGSWRHIMDINVQLVVDENTAFIYYVFCLFFLMWPRQVNGWGSGIFFLFPDNI